MLTTSITRRKRAFRKGWSRVANEDMKPLKELLAKILDISIPALYARMRGESGHLPGDEKKIEKAFAQFGYPAPWDDL